MDEKQLLDAIRKIVRDEAGESEQRINGRINEVVKRVDVLEANLNKRIDTVEQAVLETSQNVKDIKDRSDTTETDVRLLKKLASQ